MGRDMDGLSANSSARAIVQWNTVRWMLDVENG